METVGSESKPKTGVNIVNYRMITFETDIQRIRSLREELETIYIDKSTGNIEPQEEVSAILDEVTKLLDVIIQADN
jgi:hypothetical protein